MYYQIRNCCFETNSSNTHSMCICKEDLYNSWVNGEAFYDDFTEEIVMKKDAKKIAREEGIPFEDLIDDRFITYDSFFDDSDLDCYEKTYADGDLKLVIFGKYGRNG